jgi:hypothetical protein
MPTSVYPQIAPPRPITCNQRLFFDKPASPWNADMVRVIANIQKPLDARKLRSICILYVHNWTKSTRSASDKEHPPPGADDHKIAK